VDLVTSIDPGLDPQTVRDVVTGVAAGRAKVRRLAAALAQRPAVLCDGRSPAPLAVGELLVALRAAGGESISAPLCARCDRPLRGSMVRRGQDWCCHHPCGRDRDRCTGCGHHRAVSRRDLHGRPYCPHCRPADAGDPQALLVDLITGLDPSLGADTVAAAVERAAPAPAARQRLASTIRTQLSGDGLPCRCRYDLTCRWSGASDRSDRSGRDHPPGLSATKQTSPEGVARDPACGGMDGHQEVRPATRGWGDVERDRGRGRLRLAHCPEVSVAGRAGRPSAVVVAAGHAAAVGGPVRRGDRRLVARGTAASGVGDPRAAGRRIMASPGTTSGSRTTSATPGCASSSRAIRTSGHRRCIGGSRPSRGPKPRSTGETRAPCCRARVSGGRSTRST